LGQGTDVGAADGPGHGPPGGRSVRRRAAVVVVVVG